MIRLLAYILSHFGYELVPKGRRLHTSSDVLEQAKALASAALASKRATDAQAKPIWIGRPSYAQTQANWEWAHNRRAQELLERARTGFF